MFGIKAHGVLRWGNRRSPFGLVKVCSDSVDVICGGDSGDAAAKRSTGNARLSALNAYRFVASSRMWLYDTPLWRTDEC